MTSTIVKQKMFRYIENKDRTDYDLMQHMNHSKQDLTYQEPETNEKYVPYVIEPSLGADRVVLAFLCNSYDEEEISEGDTRTVLHLHPAIAPYKVAVLPLSKKLSEKKREKLYDQILEEAISYGVGIIGQDEIDEINILNATKQGVTQVVEGLDIKPDLILVDALTHINTKGIPYAK